LQTPGVRLTKSPFFCTIVCLPTSGQLQATAQQLKEELSSTVSPLQTQLQAAAATLADHASALESTRSVAAAVQMLQALPAAAADLSSRLDELAQAQRAAEGELAAHTEHNLVLDQQLATASVQLQALEAAIGQQQERGGQQLQQLRQELLEPVVEELDRLQQHKLRLQQLQQEQAAAVERLGGALEAVKGEVLAELGRERQQLAQVGGWHAAFGRLQPVQSIMQQDAWIALHAPVSIDEPSWFPVVDCGTGGAKPILWHSRQNGNSCLECFYTVAL